MNNLTSARSTLKDQLVIVKRKHTWGMSWLHIGTFGSFIGYSAAFPLLIGACGGYLIQRGFGASTATGGPNLALEVFLTFYVTCAALTWWYYLRKSVRRARSLAEARV